MEIKNQLQYTLNEFNVTGLGKHYRGKVRDNYIQDDQILIVTTDRISAFDRVLSTIPFKGEILTQIARFWFDKSSSIVPNHIISYPDPQVMSAKKVDILPVEMIVRNYITGSLWREYEQGINGQYGFLLPDGLVKNQKFDTPILTPSTKAEYGKHDEPISRQEIISLGLVDEGIYKKVENYALQLFALGKEWAAGRGLILVDTKYEFGLRDGEVILADEVHTPDSSRYWIADEYESRFRNNQDQKMLDKENIRQWLIEQGFSGDGTPPELTDEVRVDLAEKYIRLYQILTGKSYRIETGSVEKRILSNLKDAGYAVDQ